jgi:hypothetical protein
MSNNPRRRGEEGGEYRGGATQLLWSELGKSGHDTCAGCHGQQLDLHATHPAHGRQVIHQQQVVGLVIKTPLADDEGGPRILRVLKGL